jgi:hypothetical protein
MSAEAVLQQLWQDQPDDHHQHDAALLLMLCN